MVDLVKIRKKAKKGEKGEKSEPVAASGEPDVREVSGQQAAVSEPEAPVETPAAPSPHEAPSKLERFKEEVGKKREGLIHTEDISESGEIFELLTFVIAGENYALDIEHIVEIVTPRDPTRVPNADDSIVGIISLRGTIVTLLDVRRRLQHPTGGAADADTRVVVVQFGDEMVGFQVDRVLRVVKVDRTAIEPHPVVHVSEQSEAIRGVFHHANALTILLDFDKLLGARHGTHV